MKLVFNDNDFAFQFLRIVGGTSFGFADVGEAIAAAEQIKDGDFADWCRNWTKVAKRLHLFADTSYSNGHRISASEAYMRASNYYRAAEFYLHGNPDDPQIEQLYDASLHCFKKAIDLGDSQMEFVQIPYENDTLPGHYYHAQGEMKAKPTLIVMTGFDGTKEELYGIALAAVKRGINCLAFEGPGQGSVVRKQHLKFRPDYEKVISSVVDYLESRDDVNSKRIILWGQSLGGYLAPRAAAFEHRLFACIADSGIYEFLASKIPPNIPKDQYFIYIAENQEKANQEFESYMKQNTFLEWFFHHGMYVLGAQTPAEVMLLLKEYTLEGLTDQIQCTTLIVDGENEQFAGGQAKMLFDMLNCPKEFMYFTNEEGAGDHCQIGSPLIAYERIFNWIEDTINQA